MANDLFVELQQKLEGKNVRIVLPEAYDERVLEAAVKLGATSYVKPVLVGKRERVEEIAHILLKLTSQDLSSYQEASYHLASSYLEENILDLWREFFSNESSISFQE